MTSRPLRSAFTSMAVTALTLLAVGAVAPPVAAADRGCVVVNAATALTTSDLQAALDAADSGDVLRVSGVCVGGFVVDKSVSLVGVATAATPVATLDGAGERRVLDVVGAADARPRVVLRDLLVTGGVVARGGGGVRINNGELTMTGTTAIYGNVARGGAGVVMRDSDVTLTDTASVAGNSASNKGGGVRVLSGDLLMLDSSVVAENAADSGTGIHSRGRVVLDGSATVTYNGVGAAATAVWNAEPGTLVLRRDASVSDNHGRGVLNAGTAVLQGHSRVAGNVNRHSGAGVLVDGGTVTIQGHAVVARNDARRFGSGGGVLVYGGTLTLLDHARVRHNTSVHGGGGLTVYGRRSIAVLSGSASVLRNTTEGLGGGVEVLRGVLRLERAASITENTAGMAGGGIWVDPQDDASVAFDSAWTGTVCGNTPDDWPTCS